MESTTNALSQLPSNPLHQQFQTRSPPPKAAKTKGSAKRARAPNLENCNSATLNSPPLTRMNSAIGSPYGGFGRSHVDLVKRQQNPTRSPLSVQKPKAKEEEGVASGAQKALFPTPVVLSPAPAVLPEASHVLSPVRKSQIEEQTKAVGKLIDEMFREDLVQIGAPPKKSRQSPFKHRAFKLSKTGDHAHDGSLPPSNKDRRRLFAQTKQADMIRGRESSDKLIRSAETPRLAACIELAETEKRFRDRLKLLHEVSKALSPETCAVLSQSEWNVLFCHVKHITVSGLLMLLFSVSRVLFF